MFYFTTFGDNELHYFNEIFLTMYLSSLLPKEHRLFFSVCGKGISLIFCDHLLIVHVTIFKVTKITETVPFTLALLQQKGPHSKNTLVSASASLCGGGEGGTQCLLAVVYDLLV